MAFLFAVVFVDALGFGLVLPLLPAYLPSVALPGLAAGGVVSLFSLLQFLGLPVLGVLSDRIGRRPVLLAGLVGTAGAYALLALARSPLGVFAGIALGGLLSGTISTAQAVVADIADGSRRARLLGVLGVGYGAGITVGPLVAAVASSVGPWAAPAAASLLAIANAAVGAITFHESLAPSRRDLRALRALDLVPVAAIARPLARPGLRFLYGAVLLVNASLMAVVGTASVYTARRFGWGGRENGILFAALGAIGAVAQIGLLPLLERHLGDRRHLPGALAAAALALAAVPSIAAGWLLYPALGLFAAGIGVAIPALTAMVSGLAGEDSKGTALAGMNALVSIAFVVSPLVAGALAGASPAAPWIFAAAAAAAAAALTIRGRAAGAR